MEETKYSRVWNLDNLFPGGSESSQLSEHIKVLDVKVNKFEDKLNFFNTPRNINESEKVADLLDYIGDIQIYISQANSFITCLLAQNPKDQHTITLKGKITTIHTRFESELKK